MASPNHYNTVAVNPQSMLNTIEIKINDEQTRTDNALTLKANTSATTISLIVGNN